MFNINEEIKFLKYLFSTGQIDEKTYNEKVSKLLNSDKYDKYYYSTKLKEYRFFKNFFLLTIFLVLFCFMIRTFTKNTNETNDTNNKNYKNIKTLTNIQSPIQTRTSGSIFKKIDNENIKITYVAEYTIVGRVVDVQNYRENNLENKLSPIDIGLSWGFLANEENHQKLNWSSLGNRFLSWYTSNNEWVNMIGGRNQIIKNHSNNHLIPSNNEIEKLIKNIKEDDYIMIEGYLVNINCNLNDGSNFYWNTSTSRSDEGNGACELIYVNNIIWLKDI